MVSKDPQLALTRDEILPHKLVNLRTDAGIVNRIKVQNLVVGNKARQVNIKAIALQFLKFKRNSLHIPLAQLAQPVVSKNIGPPLRLRQIFYKNAWHFFNPELLRRHYAAMPGNQVKIFVNQTRRQETELLNAVF